MELIGKLKKVNDIIERADFKSRKIWITTEDNPQYPQTIEVEVQKDKVDMFNGIAIGAPVTLSLNLRGREWTSKEGEVRVFNTLVCWRAQAGHIAKPLDTSLELPAGAEDLPF